MNSPIKWHGGKSYLAKRIIELMPEHIHYVEPFFGGGSVLFKKPDELIEGHSEVVNDIYGDLVNFWKVLKSWVSFEEFQRRVGLTPFSQDDWDSSLVATPLGSISQAVAFFIRYRQSRQGLGKDFATLSRNRTRRGMNEQVSSWLSAIDGLPEAHERLQRVVVLNNSALEVIRREDGENTFFYCDPPYLKSTRVSTEVYEHEMTDSQHADFLSLLGTIQGKFMISGYRSKLYDQWADLYAWNRVDIEIDNKASSKKVKDKKTECLWMNY